MRWELHCHSTRSDGAVAPETVAGRAADDGVFVFCLTDHDTTAGHAATAELASSSMRVLRGLELSCHHARRAVHVLVYDVARDDRWDALEDVLAEVASARRERVRTMAARLAEIGIRIDADAIIAKAGHRTIGRPDVAQALVDAGAVHSRREAFDRYLHDGGPIDVPTSRLALEEGIEVAAATGARLSLAHPHVHGPRRTAEILRRGAPLGLTGLEVYYGPYSPAQRDEWRKLADEHGLVATGGSDFHVDPSPGPPATLGVELDDGASARLCDWLEVDRPHPWRPA